MRQLSRARSDPFSAEAGVGVTGLSTPLRSSGSSLVGSGLTGAAGQVAPRAPPASPRLPTQAPKCWACSKHLSRTAAKSPTVPQLCWAEGTALPREPPLRSSRPSDWPANPAGSCRGGKRGARRPGGHAHGHRFWGLRAPGREGRARDPPPRRSRGVVSSRLASVLVALRLQRARPGAAGYFGRPGRSRHSGRALARRRLRPAAPRPRPRRSPATGDGLRSTSHLLFHCGKRPREPASRRAPRRPGARAHLLAVPQLDLALHQRRLGHLLSWCLARAPRPPSPARVTFTARRPRRRRRGRASGGRAAAGRGGARGVPTPGWSAGRRQRAPPALSPPHQPHAPCTPPTHPTHMGRPTHPTHPATHPQAWRLRGTSGSRTDPARPLLGRGPVQSPEKAAEGASRGRAPHWSETPTTRPRQAPPPRPEADLSPAGWGAGS